MTDLLGVHHATVLARDPIANLRFVIDALGLRLVRRGVCEQDPTTYHLQYGDRTGTPGTVLSFRHDREAERSDGGTGAVGRITFGAPAGTIARWRDRIGARGARVEELSAARTDGPFDSPRVDFTDPDGTPISIVEIDEPGAATPWEHPEIAADIQLRGIVAITIDVPDPEETGAFLRRALGFEPWAGAAPVKRDETPNSFWFELPGEQPGRYLQLRRRLGDTAHAGAGFVQYVAWRVADHAALDRVAAALLEAGLTPSPVADRGAFLSTSVTIPGGVRFDFATDAPGFAADVPEAKLGHTLHLPGGLADRREEIETSLVPGTDQFDRVLRVVAEPMELSDTAAD
jgi:glyoxalase family protein